MTALKLEAQEQSDCQLERFHALSGMTCGCSLMCFALEDEAHMSVSDMVACSLWLGASRGLLRQAAQLADAEARATRCVAAAQSEGSLIEKPWVQRHMSLSAHIRTMGPCSLAVLIHAVLVSMAPHGHTCESCVLTINTSLHSSWSPIPPLLSQIPRTWICTDTAQPAIFSGRASV